MKKFAVLKGGMSETGKDSTKVFSDAYTTNTRLMGQSTCYIHWLLPDNSIMRHLHQFFIMNCEDGEIDTYEELVSDDAAIPNGELESRHNSYTGGLGGKNVPLTEREVLALIQSYAASMQRKGMEMPDQNSEFSFLLEHEVHLTPVEKAALFAKQCTEIRTNYELINYFLMRLFGKDLTAAAYLTKAGESAAFLQEDTLPQADLAGVFDTFPQAVLLRNTIEESGGSYIKTSNDEFGSFTTERKYLCESLVETDDAYYIVTSEIGVLNTKVTSAEKISSFMVTPDEVALMMLRPEYITVYNLQLPGLAFQPETSALASRAVISDAPGGRLFMIMKPNNDHVNQREYEMREDVLGLYFVSDSGQIVACAKNLDSMDQLDFDLMHSNLADFIEDSLDHFYDMPVFFDFINSGIDDFEEFAEMIEGEDE